MKLLFDEEKSSLLARFQNFSPTATILHTTTEKNATFRVVPIRERRRRWETCPGAHLETRNYCCGPLRERRRRELRRGPRGKSGLRPMGVGRGGCPSSPSANSVADKVTVVGRSPWKRSRLPGPTIGPKVHLRWPTSSFSPSVQFASMLVFCSSQNI